MKTSIIAAATLALALGACGKTGTASDNGVSTNGAGSASASGGPAGATASGPAAEGLKLRPGYYETETQSAISGLPPQLAKALGAEKKTGRHCISPKEANRPSADLFGGKKQPGCQSKDVAYAGGRIHGVLACAGKGHEGGGVATITLDGTYTADSYEVRSHIVTRAGGGQSMTIDSRATAHRVGDCPAGSEND
jgi:hypothetical protein